MYSGLTVCYPIAVLIYLMGKEFVVACNKCGYCSKAYNKRNLLERIQIALANPMIHN